MAWLPVRGYDMLSCAIKGIGVLEYSVLVSDAYTAVCTVLPERSKFKIALGGGARLR
eukprot:SAG31_NODE_2588_length_5419_cov_15.402778_3_plen_57_part_00